MGAWAGLLVHADLTWRRLPDRLTLPAAVGALLGALLVDPLLLVPGLLWPALYLLVGIFCACGKQLLIIHSDLSLIRCLQKVQTP